MIRLSILTALALSSMLPATAAASAIAEINSSAESLRFELPDEIYVAGVTADFVQLQVVDAERRNVDFAVCPVTSTEEATLVTQAIEVPNIARVITDGTGALQLEFSPGARHPGEAQDWVIDTRLAESAISALAGLPPIEQLRNGPNLRQWGRPLEFVQQGDKVSFEAQPSPYFRVRLKAPQATGEQPPAVTAHLQRRQKARTPHWYDLEPGEEGSYRNTRKLPVIAARVVDAEHSEGWLVESRQGDWDAWKPHARIAPGQASTVSRFSAVTDPQWRLRGGGTLQLAHPAYEIRIPRVPADQPLRILRLEQGRFGPGLSCRHTDKLPTRAPDKFQATESALPRADDKRDLRGGFLILLLLAVGTGLIVQRYRKSRPGR